jgi:hypothetical protein
VGRPFVPVIDFQVLADSLFGDPEVTLKDKTLMGEWLGRQKKTLLWPPPAYFGLLCTAAADFMVQVRAIEPEQQELA